MLSQVFCFSSADWISDCHGTVSFPISKMLFLIEKSTLTFRRQLCEANFFGKNEKHQAAA